MSLTADIVKKRLQIAQCCLVQQGVAIIEKQKRGKGSCKYDLSQIQFGFNLIDSIVGYDPTFENNCLTEIQVQHILDKLCKMCPNPCTTYVGGFDPAYYLLLESQSYILFENNGRIILE